jgi:hypothetical protein
MADKRYTTGPDGVLLITPMTPQKQGYVTPEIADLNPPEVIAACRLRTLIRFMGELEALAPYHDALMAELIKQGAGKPMRIGKRKGIDVHFKDLVESLKQKSDK